VIQPYFLTPYCLIYDFGNHHVDHHVIIVLQVGLFSLGIIPYINASIVLQLMSAAFPALKKMQREDGPQGRARFQYYQKLAAFVFAIAQVQQRLDHATCCGLILRRVPR
jgi:hypothetical protein